VYSVNVSADGPGAEGCGAPGRVVRFTVGGQVMAEALAWDNDRPAEVSLGAPAQLYLPLIRR